MILRSTFILQRCTHVYTSTNIIYNKILLQYPVLYIVHCLLPLYKFVKITIKTLYLFTVPGTIIQVPYHVPHNSRLNRVSLNFHFSYFFFSCFPLPQVFDVRIHIQHFVSALKIQKSFFDAFTFGFQMPIPLIQGH